MLRILFLALLLAAVSIALAIRYLPWYVSVGLLIAFFVSAKYLFRWGIRRALMIPFRMKGGALRGATIEVHSVEPTTAPVRRVEPEVDEEEERQGELETIRTTDAEGVTTEVLSPVSDGDESEEEREEVEDRTPRDWYRIDLTIRPTPNPGGFQFWEPSEFFLVPYDMKVSLDSLDGDETSPVEEVRVWDPETRQWMKDDPGKYPGEQRLQLVFGIKPAAPRRWKLQYYFESFGEIELPRGATQGVE